MTFPQEWPAKLKQQRARQAIALAMQGQWQEAIAVNKSIIEHFPNDMESYNRLGRAYMELGRYSQARESYQRAIELNPYNTIAQKNLRRLEHLIESPTGTEGNPLKAEPHHFIEEIGKAGIFNLQNLAPKQILARMNSGDKVELKIEGNNLNMENLLGEYLGQVEVKHAQRLIKLMIGGNKYSAAIVSAAEDKITVIIREEYQDPSQVGQISFPPRGLQTTRPGTSHSPLNNELENEEELHENNSEANNNSDGNED